MSDCPIPRSYWVIPGRLLAGEYPLARHERAQPEQLQRLLDAGIDCFLDLTQPREMPGYDRRLPPFVQYINQPIPDHDVPKKPSQMQDIQLALQHALAADRVVYVHCRAGIGRTGTVIGCHLVEQGLEGDQALTELVRLWQQNELSRIWPDIPETDEQIRYVREWPKHALRGDSRRASVPEEQPEAVTAVRTLRDRFHGCLLGMAVCDALAAATQFRRPGSFAPVGDLLGGGPFGLPRGAYSDDTATALCVADSMLASGALEPRDLLTRLLRWQQEGYLSATGQCVGISANTAKALAAAHWRRQAFAGSHDPAQLDAEPLVRVAPVALHDFADLAATLADAMDVARVTSQAPLVLDACRLLAGMLHTALRGEPRARVITPPGTLFNAAPLRREIAQLAMSAPVSPPPPGRNGAGSDALGTLQAARWALHSTTSFRAGALAAVNLGGNSDVIATIYGQLAGAHYGIGAIPGAWLVALAQRASIEELADQLLATALVRMGEGASGR